MVSATPTPVASACHDPDLTAFVRQRKDDIARSIREQRERSLAIANGIADAHIRRAFLQAEAAHERAITDFWRRFFKRTPKQRDQIARHVERSSPPVIRGSRMRATNAPPAGARQLAGYGGLILDRKGRLGVYLSVSYLGAKRTAYGCARRLVRYVTDPKHVEWLDGLALTGSNVGDDRAEVSAAFGLVEDLNRAARANAKVVFHLIVQLPYDVMPAERAEIMRRWCEEQFGMRNVPYAWAVHTPSVEGNQRNYHGHVAVSFRPLVRVAPFTWDAGRELKAELDNPEQFRIMRERFAQAMTEVVQAAGKQRVYTALSHAARGLKIKPTEHLGAHKTRLVRRGEYVAADARNRAKINSNEAMLEIERLDRRRAAMERRLAQVRRSQVRSVAAATTVAHPAGHGATPVRRLPTARRPKRSPSPSSATVAHSRRSVLQPRPISKTRTAQRPSAPAIDGILDVTRGTIAVSRSTTQPIHVMIAARPAPAVGQRITDIAAAWRHSISSLGVVSAVPGTSSRSHVARPDAVLQIPAVRALPAYDQSVGPPNILVADRQHVRSGMPPIGVPEPAMRNQRVPHVFIVETGTAPRPDRRKTDVQPPAEVSRPQPNASQRLIRPADDDVVAQRRRKAKASARRHRERATLAAIDRLSWAPNEHAPVGLLAEIETLDALPSFAPATADPEFERIVHADLYVWDDGAGRLTIDPAAQFALKLTDDRLDAATNQAVLAALRHEQQQVFALLVEEARQRPLAFSRSGPRPWPRGFAPEVLARLDRWSRDEGFKQDLFLAVQMPVSDAHRDNDARERTRAVANDSAGTASATTPMSDGFGGTRTSSPPAHTPTAARVRIASRDPVTGAPTDQLLLLARFAGEQPRLVDRATDGRLTTLPGAPAIPAALLDLWRHDPAIDELITRIVTDSRAAGRPTFPADIAVALRVQRQSEVRRPLPDHDRGWSR